MPNFTLPDKNDKYINKLSKSLFEKLALDVSKIENKLYEQYEIFDIGQSSSFNPEVYEYITDVIDEDIEDFLYCEMDKINMTNNRVRLCGWLYIDGSYNEDFSDKYNHQFKLYLHEIEFFKINKNIYILIEPSFISVDSMKSFIIKKKKKIMYLNILLMMN